MHTLGMRAWKSSDTVDTQFKNTHIGANTGISPTHSDLFQIRHKTRIYSTSNYFRQQTRLPQSGLRLIFEGFPGKGSPQV